MDIKATEEKARKSIEVFCCYAREDQRFLHKLKDHLIPLQRMGRITLWADIDINAGTEWENEIHRHLDKAQVILLLVSSNFMASEYCYSVEMRKAMERHEQGEACVIPIILSHVNWKITPLSKLQALPTDAKPIRNWHPQDQAFSIVVEGIIKVLEDIELKKVKETHGELLVGITNASSFASPTSYGRNRPANAETSQNHPHVSLMGILEGENVGISNRRQRKQFPVIVLAVTIAALVVPLLISSSSQIHTILSIPLVNAHIDGWLFMQVTKLDGKNGLETMNLQTGQVRLLADSTTFPNLTDFAAPYYSSAAQQLVFTATDEKTQFSGVWIAKVTVGKDGWPTLSNIPTPLTSSCNPHCNVLTWSHSGQSLIFQGKDGLYTIIISTHQQQLIPSSSGASWPACSPDGRWLAYQDTLTTTIEAIPSNNCLPSPGHQPSSLYVNGIAYAWHPRWSVDGKYLTFLANNRTPNGSLYEIALKRMSPVYRPDASTAQYTPVGTLDCSYMTWVQQSQQQNIVILGCEERNCLLIEPNDAAPEWEAKLCIQNEDTWGWPNWAPMVTNS